MPLQSLQRTQLGQSRPPMHSSARYLKQSSVFNRSYRSEWRYPEE